jgi:acyl-CoA synthetase (AMP-forming)/AMP-acid ligase II
LFNPLRLIHPQRLIVLARRLWPNSDYLVAGTERLSRRELLARVDRLAAGLQFCGVRPGDRVVTLLPASPEAVYSLFLPWVLGNVEVPLNPLLREHELRHVLADCGAQVVLTTRKWYGQDYPAMLSRLRQDLPALRTIVVAGTEPGWGDDRSLFSLQDVMAAGQPLRRVRVSPHALGRITYTSGTTGLPKGVMHTLDGYWGLLHPAVLGDLRALRSLFLPFPPCYYSGWLGLMATLLSGGKVTLMERFTPVSVLEIVARERVSWLTGSPTMFRLLLNTPGQERYDLSSVRVLTFSTEPCPPELAQALYERFRCSLVTMYGSNECGNATWTRRGDPWEKAAATVGRPVPGARLRIVGEARRPLPPGERGEIAVQTAQMMRGYYNAPEATARVLDAAGWYYTGDIGYLGEDGYLRLVDRKLDVIIRGGQNVYPAEVEAYLEHHPAIRRAGVVGVPGTVSGETVWSYLERRPGTSLSAQEVLDFCRGQIAPFKIPAEVRFVGRLPTSASGKVQRFRLREMALQEVSAPGGSHAVG